MSPGRTEICMQGQEGQAVPPPREDGTPAPGPQEALHPRSKPEAEAPALCPCDPAGWHHPPLALVARAARQGCFPALRATSPAQGLTAQQPRSHHPGSSM